MILRLFGYALFAAGLTTTAIAADLTPGIAALKGERFLEHIKTLSSDDFEGRSPGTRGEELTVAYIEQQFKEIGLKPGNPDGTYVQHVPLTGFLTTPTVSFKAGGKTITPKTPDEFVGFSTLRQAATKIDASELVFVGYGIDAPEYGWDDFKGVDVRGKTIVVLINDPPVPDANDASKLDDAVFGGKAMTYYGRWIYKYEMAAKLGAKAAIIVHETEPAAYPFSVVVSSWARENFDLNAPGEPPRYPPLAAWMTRERTEELFKAAGVDFETLKRQAATKAFKPVTLRATFDADIRNIWTDAPSRNVVGKLEGSDPALKAQYVVYSAHWDHMGWDQKLPGPKSKQVFHGARDNASGIAVLLEAARAFKALPTAPKRSILFVATTAEERLLLGARYYARHPLYPLKNTLANINMDGAPVWGRTRDVELVSSGKSSLDEIVGAAAREMNLTVKPDSHPERGSVYRSDQLEFALVGVPVVYLKDGMDVIGKPAGFADKLSEHYVAHDYHQVGDVIGPDWTMDGAVQFTELLVRIGHAVTEAKEYPQWHPTAEFKAARDATLKN